MNYKTLKTIAQVVAVGIGCSLFSAASSAQEPTRFEVQIKDKPLTFCNPLNINAGSERIGRLGEPVVVLFKGDYYLFAGGAGYYVSPNLRDWTLVTSPSFPRGIPSVATDGKTLYACVMNARGVFTSTDPKQGTWTQAGTFDSDRYGDADLFIDDNGKFYMYWGWSQLMPFQAVEIDPKTFKEIGKSVVCFFGDYKQHGFERRRPEDLIFPYFNHRPYFPEEYPWIEGPWMVKHKGKYYLTYAAIGLEFRSYSTGVYVSDSPLGPFKYQPENPLAFKTTGFMLGAGHGSTFHDKNGDLWTICMVPSFYGGGRGSSELALYPAAVDADGVMHADTSFGDYPQYLPGIKKNAVENNFTKWMLLSAKKHVEVSSTLDGFPPANAVDEDMTTHWAAKTGNAGEQLTVDLGKECEIYALQVNFDQQFDPTNAPAGRGAGPGGFGGFGGFGGRGGAPGGNARYNSYTIQISSDNQTFTTLIDKSNNTQDRKHDYIELPQSANARYVRITNVFTENGGLFAIKDLRVFGNPKEAKFTEVKDVFVARNLDDPRDATITWQPLKNADGYVVRYGVKPGKLYNSYMVYDANTITVHSLNRDQKYYFKVEAFDSGTDYYREKTEMTLGRGAEIELSTGRGGRGGGAAVRKMTFEGVNEYVFDNIAPGTYTLRHTFGPTLWSGQLTEDQVIGTGDKPTVTADLTPLGTGTKVLGKMQMKVIPGPQSGKIIVTFSYDQAMRSTP